MTRILPRPGHPPRRMALPIAIAFALPLAAAHAADPQQATVEELARRLEAIERRLGLGEYASGDASSIADLQQRIAALERKLELQDEAAATKAQAAAAVTASTDKGLSVKSADGELEVKLRGLVQADGRYFLDDQQQAQSDTFLLRRVEPTLEGSWGSLLGFRLQAQLAGDSATLNDAYIDLKFHPAAQLRVGKYKQPFGLEQLQSSGALAAIERGLPSELTPPRDYGVQLQGTFAGGTLNYALGAFNGTVDGRDAATSNPDDEFEYAARIFAEPWKNAGNALSGLGFGVAATAGDTAGSGNSFLPRYRTPGQAQFFGYLGDVLADGRRRRWSPQAYWYHAGFGTQAEYVASEQDVVAEDGTRAALDHRAWQITASMVLTGEDASYRGVVKPSAPFSPGEGGWGAFELVGRYGTLDIDDDAFPLFADPDIAASSAKAWTIGFNWYLTSSLKLVANYTQTRFEGGAPDGADREDEKAFFTRAQFQF